MSTWLIALLLGPSPFYRDGAASTRLVGRPPALELELDLNGLPAPIASTLPGGAPVPDVQWWGDDPTGALGITSHTFTASGSPTTGVDTPFCPDGGGWGDLSGCLQSVDFDGANDYYVAGSTSVAEIGTSDATICVVLYVNPTVANVDSFASTGGWGASGYNLVWDAAGRVDAYKLSNGATEVPVYGPTVSAVGSGWTVACLLVDFGATAKIIANGSAGASADISALASINNAAALHIGSRHTGAGNFWDGRILFFSYWAQLLTDAQVEAFEDAWLGLLEAGNRYTPSYSNTGPTCWWVDGEVECYSDDFPPYGCEPPPGATAGGTSTPGVCEVESLTNSILYSRDLTTGWSATGTPDVAASSLTPFRDGRTVYQITDNDAAAQEGVYQQTSINILSLDVGDPVTACVYAASSSADTIGIRMTEHTGVDCTASATTDHVSTSSSWTLAQSTHTVADTDCTYIQLYIAPGSDIDANATTGGPVAFVAQVYIGQDWCPPTYIETTSAAVTAGGHSLSYTVSGPLVGASGDLPGLTRVCMDVTPLRSAWASNGVLWQIDDGTATAQAHTAWTTTNTLGLYAAPPGAYQFYTAATAPTAGTTTEVCTRLDYGGDQYSIWVDGANLKSGTPALDSPTGLDRFQIGGDGGSSPLSPASISNVRIYR